MTAHELTIRVYYEDTDFAGIVYYANYLKYIERGRSEWVRALGIDQKRLREEQGIVFVVRHLEADYLKPGCFDDVLLVTTVPVGRSKTKIVLKQDVSCGSSFLFRASVTLVAIDAAGRPTRLPTIICENLPLL